MKIVIDMNLPPEWASVLAEHGLDAEHWSAIGSPKAEDSEILEWAKENDAIVFTHDLDFGGTSGSVRCRAAQCFSNSHTGRSSIADQNTGDCGSRAV